MRTIKNGDKLILEQLEKLGLHWDEKVVYQSQRHDLYQNAIEQLQASNLLYDCSCSRKELANKPYPGTCRNGVTLNNKDSSLRIRTDNNKIVINDQLQENHFQEIENELGDFIIKTCCWFLCLPSCRSC